MLKPCSQILRTKFRAPSSLLTIFVCQDRQTEELIELREKHERELAEVRPKPSREILNLKKIQETLAKQKEYIEAQKVKSKVDQLVSARGLSWCGISKWGASDSGWVFVLDKQTEPNFGRRD
jgi:hypothetical protein